MAELEHPMPLHTTCAKLNHQLSLELIVFIIPTLYTEQPTVKQANK